MRQPRADVALSGVRPLAICEAVGEIPPLQLGTHGAPLKAPDRRGDSHTQPPDDVPVCANLDLDRLAVVGAEGSQR